MRICKLPPPPTSSLAMLSHFSGFPRRLMVYASLFISSSVIYWYTVDWHSYEDGVAIGHALPTVVLLFAQAVDWLQYPLAHAGHALVHRASELDAGPRSTALQLSVVLVFPFVSAFIYAWLVTVVTGRIRSNYH